MTMLTKRLMQLVAHDLDLDPKRFPVRAIMNWVSACKNELVDHESASERARPSRRVTPRPIANIRDG